jgi:hypothetical protein
MLDSGFGDSGGIERAFLFSVANGYRKKGKLFLEKLGLCPFSSSQAFMIIC